MDSSLTLVFVGGAISLVSTLATLLVSHWLELKRLSAQVKQYPTQVIYEKQTEFFDKAVAVLDEVNGYISQIDVWLAERGDTTKEQLRHAAANNEALTRLHELVGRYYMYLPEKLLRQADELFFECLRLGAAPSERQAHKCLDFLFSLQNTIREVVGIDAVSRDLLKAFSSGEQPKAKDTTD